MQPSGGQSREAEDEVVEAVGSQAASSGSLNISNSQGASNLHTTHAEQDAAQSLPSTTMAAAATPDSTVSAASGAVAAPVAGQPGLLNRTNSERLGQKPNQRKTFQELMSIRNEDRHVTETVLSENTEFETTLGLEEYSLNSGTSLLESVNHHRNSRSAHVRHHEEVSSVDICHKRVEHVYKSNFRMPDGSSVAVMHEEVYHTTDPNVEVTVCLAQSLPSADCRPGRANVADLAVGNEWASLLLSCDGFRDDQLCSMLLKKEGEHGAEAAAEAAAVASSVAAAVSLAAADSSPPVVDVSLSSEITHPLPNAYVALYGEDDNVSADSSSAESVVEVAEAKNRTNPPSKLTSTKLPQKTKCTIDSTYQEFQKQAEDTQKDSTEAKTPVSAQHTKFTETTSSTRNTSKLQATWSEAKESKDPIKPVRPEERLRESRPLKRPVEQQGSQLNRALQKNDASPTHSEGSDTTSGSTATIDVALQQRMEAFLDSKKTKSENLQHVPASESTTLESKKVTVLEEVSVVSNDFLTVFRAPTESARLSVSEKMCMEVLAEPYDPDASDSDDENSTRPRGFYSYLCDGPRSRPNEEDDAVKIFQRVETTERRLTRGEILTVEFNASSADSSSVTNVNLDAKLEDKSHDNSRYHMVYVRDPTANSYVKVHEPIYDDVSPKGSNAPSESSSNPGSIDEPPSTTVQRHTASQYLDNPLSPLSPSFQQSGIDQVDMRISHAASTTSSSSVSATSTTTPTSQQVTQLTVVTSHDSGTTDEKFSPGLVKRRAEQYEVRRAIRNQTAEERKSYQELINSGIVQVKRKEHEDLIEKDAMPPSPSDFRFEVDPDQLERVVYQNEVSTVAPAQPSASSPKEASVVAPIIRQMEQEAVFEFQPAKKSSSNQHYRSAPGKKGSDKAPFKPAASGESLRAASSSAQVRPAQVGRGDLYPAQDDRSRVLPIKKPSTETANVSDEPQPFSPRSVESEAVLRYDRAQENRWYSVSGSDERTHFGLLKTQTSEEQGKWLDPDAAGRSETLRYDRAQENLLPSAALGEVTQVEHLKGSDSDEDTKLKISTQSERFELKQLPPASTSDIVGTSEDSSPSSGESDGGGDYDTGYEQQYDLQEVLKKVKPKPPKGQHHPHKPPHEFLPISLASLAEADDEGECESESDGDSSSEGSSQVLVDDGVLSDQQRFPSTGHTEQKSPINILIDDENSIPSLLVQDASPESASSESDEDDEDEDYNEIVRSAAEWYKSHPVEEMYLPRRHILATIDEETVSPGSTSIPSQSTDAEVTVISQPSGLSNQDTILVRPPSPSKVTSSVAPVMAEEEDLSGSGASDSDKATKTQSPNVPQEAEEDIDILKTTPSSQYRSAVRLPVSIQVAKVAQTDAQLIREQNSHASTTQLQSSDDCVTISKGSTALQESSAGDTVSAQNNTEQVPVDPTEKPFAANAGSDKKKKSKKKKEHHRSKERHRSKSPKPEPPSNEQSNFDFEEEAFEKTSIQSERHKAKIKIAEGSQDKSSSSNLPASTTEKVEKTAIKPDSPQSEPPSSSNVSGFKSESTVLAESKVKSKTTEKKERSKFKESENLPSPKLQEESQGKVPIQQPPILPTPAVPSEAGSEANNKSEPPPPTRLIRSSFRSSSGRKSKVAAEEKKKRPKSSSEDASVDQLLKTASNTDKASLTISKPLAPTNSNGDSVGATAAPAAESKPESNHRSQKTKKDTKARIARRPAEEVPVAPEPVLIEDNIERVDIYAKDSHNINYKSSRPASSQHEGREIQAQPQLWRSTDSHQQNKQDSTTMPELVAYATPSYSSKKAVPPAPAQQQTSLTPATMQDLPCVDVASMQTRPHRLSGSSVSPARTPTPPPATELPPAAKPAEEEKKPDSEEQKKPRRSRKEKPKVMHFSDRRRSSEPKKADEEEINADSGEEDQLQGTPADNGIDRWIDNSNKHLVGEAGRPTITGVAVNQPSAKDAPIPAPRNQPRKPEYQRQETGGFALSDTEPVVNPIAVVTKPSIDRVSLGSQSSFDQESLVVASDLSEIGDPEALNAANNGAAPAPKAAADSDSDSYESEQQQENGDEEEDDLPIMRPLSWEPISIVHPPTGVGTSATLPASQTQPPQPSTPASQPRAQTQPPQQKTPPAGVPTVGSGATSLNQGALDFMLNCLSSRPILPPGEVDSSDVAPTRLLLNPYRRQALEQARIPQPPLVAKPLPLDADERRRYERKRDAFKANNSRRRSNRLGSGRGGAEGPEGSSRSASYYRSSSALSGRELSFTALSPAVMRRQSRRRSRSRY